jgi:hypothetical protein
VFLVFEGVGNQGPYIRVVAPIIFARQFQNIFATPMENHCSTFSPHKFDIISLCGVNGHLAFGVMCAASRFINAS